MSFHENLLVGDHSNWCESAADFFFVVDFQRCGVNLCRMFSSLVKKILSLEISKPAVFILYDYSW